MWTGWHIYGDARELIPQNAPQACRKAVEITTFVNTDHAGDRVTCCSCQGVLIYVNCAPITWFSKRQNFV
jgi:hypothetical protein